MIEIGFKIKSFFLFFFCVCGWGFDFRLIPTKITNHLAVCLQTGIKLGVMSIGAPACGSNAAVRSFVRVALTKGYEVLGLHDSFDGLIFGNVRLQSAGWYKGLVQGQCIV